MKTIVKLAILCATLLLLTGIASAYNGCNCYELTCTDLDNHLVITHYVEFCYDTETNEGPFAGLCGDLGDMSWFFGVINQALAFNGYTGTTAYLTFHGTPPLNVVTGDVYCFGDRWKVWGHITDIGHCL
jgi:hypothetical protein